MSYQPPDDPETLEWWSMTPAQRFVESQVLWATYLALGGSLDPEPDSQSPFYDPETSGAAKRSSKEVHNVTSKFKSTSVRDSGQVAKTIAVHLDKDLLDRCTALAKKKRVSRDVLIARGLRALLAAEGA